MEYKKIFFGLFFHFYMCLSIQNPYNYPEALYDLSEKTKNKTGIVVITYNRPYYFQQAVDALAQNPESQTLPFVFILDGGPEATYEENIHIIKQANIKNKYIFAHDSNQGCGRTLIDARRIMFEWCKFEKILFFEDDLVVSPQYIGITLDLYHYAQKNYKNVGLVQAFNRSFLPQALHNQYKYNLIETFRNYWGYCIDAKTYFKIAPFMDSHEEFHLKNQPYNSKMVAQWIYQYILSKNRINYNNKYKINWKKFFLKTASSLGKCNYYRCGQDFEMRLALYINNIKKISTLISRASYIGIIGTSHNQTHNTTNHISKIITYKNEHICKKRPFKKNKNYIQHIIFKYIEPSSNTELSEFIHILIENGFLVGLEEKNIELKNVYYYLNNNIEKNQIFHENTIFIAPLLKKSTINKIIKENSKVYLFISNDKSFEILKEHIDDIKKISSGIICTTEEIYNKAKKLMGDNNNIFLTIELEKLIIK